MTAPAVKTAIALVMVLISVVTLELARHDVSITPLAVGQTPVTKYTKHAKDTARANDGPIVVLAHGFAGSQQMMQGYALPLARAGYQVYAFEFFGHGRHRAPMSGDVTAIEGTTRMLVQQTDAVITAVSDGRSVALIGHSMATDILVRTAQDRTDIGPLVLISAFSQAITATSPETLLLVSGAWETRLRDFARGAVQMVDPGAAEGETAIAGPVTRRAVAAPFSEHVSILQSRTARAQTVSWLDRAYGRTSDVTILPTGWAILGVLIGLVLLFAPLAKLLPQRPAEHQPLSGKTFATLVLVPAALAPLIAVPLNPEVLPVLVADYLGLHLLIYGAVQLALLWLWGYRLGATSWPAFAALLAGCAVFGFALDRYAANFWPTYERLWIIGVMMIGTVPFVLADTMLTARAAGLRRIAARVGLLLSLGIAVFLDFEGLFFLMLIAPVLVLFFVVFGTMGRAAAKRSGPLASGMALGIVLAWALGVSFPLFQS